MENNNKAPADSTCCCCISLRKGVIFISLVEIFAVIYLMATFSEAVDPIKALLIGTEVTTQAPTTTTPAPAKKLENTSEGKRGTTTKPKSKRPPEPVSRTEQSVTIIMYIASICSNVFYFAGVMKNVPPFMEPAVGMHVVGIIFYTVKRLMSFSSANQPSTYDNVVWGSGIVTAIYVTFSLRCYYREMALAKQARDAEEAAAAASAVPDGQSSQATESRSSSRQHLQPSRVSHAPYKSTSPVPS